MSGARRGGRARPGAQACLCLCGEALGAGAELPAGLSPPPAAGVGRAAALLLEKTAPGASTLTGRAHDLDDAMSVADLAAKFCFNKRGVNQ